MPRRGTITRREVLPDPVYNSKLVTQVINKVLLDGKKSTAEQIVYGALEIVREKTGRDPVEVLQDAIQALTPHLEVRSRRVGGATYQVPVEVPGRRARTLAIRWLVELRPRPPREGHGRAPRRRDARRSRRSGRRVQEEGRHLPYGAGQQGLRALSLVIRRGPLTDLRR